MKTPVLLIAGQGDTDPVADTLLARPGTVLVRHRFDGQVVRRTTLALRDGTPVRTEAALEPAHGCLSCTVRDDLLVFLRLLHRRTGVERIVVQLAAWLEPEPVCAAIDTVPVHVGPGFIDGPAGRDVTIAAVIAGIETRDWLGQALGAEELDDGRTLAQVVVGQAAGADVLVLDHPEPVTLAVLRRLAPRARITVGTGRLELALANLDDDSPRGRGDDPHGPLLTGLPPLDPDGAVAMLEFTAHRPFHPQRLHDALDPLLDGVVRARGRLWLANRPDRAMWLESAGGGLRLCRAGAWLAAMPAEAARRVGAQRRALADLIWDDRFGDRHTSMTVLVCGADPAEILDSLHTALLTDAELADPGRWPHYADPFGDHHDEPCPDNHRPAPAAGAPNREDRRR